MRTEIGSVSVELVRAEAARFHRPLLLLHGLWTDASMWRPMMGYLSHRGWESWAPSLHAATHERVVEDARTVLAGLPAHPVLVAHDLGLGTALELAAAVPATAVIAVAPLVASADGGRLGALGLSRFWKGRLGAATISPPAALLAGGEAGVTLRPDSATRFRALVGGRLRLPPSSPMPGLVVGGERDRLTPLATVQTVAARFGWEHRIHPGRGHFPMCEPGWEQVADDIHRWIVRTMGEDILALLEDDDES